MRGDIIWERTSMIGMLGGMGPESTAYIYLRMIKYCQEKYGAKLDSDYPPILMYSMPVPDVIDTIENEAYVLGYLKRGVLTLKKAGVQFSFVACNAMQRFVPQLRKEAEMLSIIEETLSSAKKTGIKNWGLLATATTVYNGLYQTEFSNAGLELSVPDAEMQVEVTAAIREILEGKSLLSPRKKLANVIASLKKQGANGIIIGCTDLPSVVSNDLGGLRRLDTADIIARAAVDRYFWLTGKEAIDTLSF